LKAKVANTLIDRKSTFYHFFQIPLCICIHHIYNSSLLTKVISKKR
jgi:hypothetical protein